MKRLSDEEIERMLVKIEQSKGDIQNMYWIGLLLNRIQIELQQRTIDELRRLYGATH